MKSAIVYFFSFFASEEVYSYRKTMDFMTLSSPLQFSQEIPVFMCNGLWYGCVDLGGPGGLLQVHKL